MRFYTLELTETVTGTARVAAASLEEAEAIAASALHDDGITAFPDLVIKERDTDVHTPSKHQESLEAQVLEVAS